MTAPGTWQEAEAAAVLAGGHLVTVNDASENLWLFNTFDSVSNHNPYYIGWIGFYQDKSDPQYSEPAGGWKWISGEPITYTAWRTGEPNNQNGEDYAVIEHGLGRPPAAWNDWGPTSIDYDQGGIAGIIEIVPEPSTVIDWSLLGTLAAGLGWWRKRKVA